MGWVWIKKYPRLIRAVSREDALRVARKYLRPENSILVVVANQKMADIESLGA
jgi:predicted Zn-dependent peptidase